jgi:Uncharacterised nucleotidyltransferase
MPETMTPAMVLSMTPEDQLCLLLARGQVTPEVRTRVLQFLATPLQWPLILERAYSHQVYPLLYRNLRDLGFPGVPEVVQAELKGPFLANALRNQLLAEELARLLSLLGEAGIRVVPLKGVALAQSLYGDTSARVCVDIDILVPPANVVQAIDLLLATGYRTEFSDPYFAKLALRHGRHYDVVREDRGISFLLEVHWILVQHSSKNNEAVDDLWAEARPQSLFGRPAFSLSPEWEFLYLSMHAADHEWRSLKWLVDIHEIVSSGLVDWQQTIKKAEEFEIDLAIGQTLAACSLLLETPLPADYPPVSPADRRTTLPIHACSGSGCEECLCLSSHAAAKASLGQAALHCNHPFCAQADRPGFLATPAAFWLSLLPYPSSTLGLQMELDVSPGGSRAARKQEPGENCADLKSACLEARDQPECFRSPLRVQLPKLREIDETRLNASCQRLNRSGKFRIRS